MPTTKFFRIAVAKDQAGDFNILLYPKYDSQGNVTVKRKFNVHWHVHNFTAAKIWVQLRDFSPRRFSFATSRRRIRSTRSHRT